MNTTPPTKTEHFGIGYQILLTVKILHRYFLDYGATGFDTDFPKNTPLSDAQIKLKKTLELIRQAYDFNLFWEILPDDNTRTMMQSQRMLLKKIADGFVILVATEISNKEKPLLPSPEGLTFVFAVYPTDPYFMLYTELDKPVMDGLTVEVEKEVVRENSNVEKVVSPTRVFRLKNLNPTNDPAKNLLNPDETIATDKLEDRPVEQSVRSRMQQPLGFIELNHKPGERGLLTADGLIQKDLTFTLILKNRQTLWRFKNDLEGKYKTKQKLVQNGRIPIPEETTQFANPTPATTTFEKDGFFYSTIY